MMEAQARSQPFPHVISASLLAPHLAWQTLEWLETEAPWKLRVEDFYEQHECDLSAETLPGHLLELVDAEAIKLYAHTMLSPMATGPLTTVDATAHKLSNGQSIRIHNDYLDGQETHRLLVQLNRGWKDEHGGFLMFFSSASADDVARIIRPLHGSAVAFEISPHSYHAVSKAASGERYTLVFSFRTAS